MSRPSRPNRRGVGAELSFGPPIRSPQTTVFPFRCVALYLCVIVPFLLFFRCSKKKGTAHKGRALKNSSSHSPHSTDDRGRDHPNPDPYATAVHLHPTSDARGHSTTAAPTQDLCAPKPPADYPIRAFPPPRASGDRPSRYGPGMHPPHSHEQRASPQTAGSRSTWPQPSQPWQTWSNSLGFSYGLAPPSQRLGKIACRPAAGHTAIRVHPPFTRNYLKYMDSSTWACSNPWALTNQ